jgi:hypothetical protein
MYKCQRRIWIFQVNVAIVGWTLLLGGTNIVAMKTDARKIKHLSLGENWLTLHEM